MNVSRTRNLMPARTQLAATMGVVAHVGSVVAGRTARTVSATSLLVMAKNVALTDVVAVAANAAVERIVRKVSATSLLVVAKNVALTDVVAVAVIAQAANQCAQ